MPAQAGIHLLLAVLNQQEVRDVAPVGVADARAQGALAQIILRADAAFAEPLGGAHAGGRGGGRGCRYEHLSLRRRGQRDSLLLQRQAQALQAEGKADRRERLASTERLRQFVVAAAAAQLAPAGFVVQLEHHVGVVVEAASEGELHLDV